MDGLMRLFSAKVGVSCSKSVSFAVVTIFIKKFDPLVKGSHIIADLRRICIRFLSTRQAKFACITKPPDKAGFYPEFIAKARHPIAICACLPNEFLIDSLATETVSLYFSYYLFTTRKETKKL
jgi:hypothetical protein